MISLKFYFSATQVRKRTVCNWRYTYAQDELVITYAIQSVFFAMW